MTQVVRREGESFDSMLKRFRTQVTRARILSAVKKKRFYVPDSEKRRVALRKAIRKEKQRQWRLRRRHSRL